MKNILGLVLLLCLSCEKEVSVDIPDQPTLTVINSLFQADSTIRVDIDQTYSILEIKDKKPIDVHIELFQNDLLVDTLVLNDNFYESDITPLLNTKYAITVRNKDGSNSMANDTIPSKVTMATTFYKDSVFTGDDGDLFSQVFLEIDDNPSEQNYYELNMALKVVNPDLAEENMNGFKQLEANLFFEPITNDIVLLNEGLLSYFPDFLIFSDELFNGSKYMMQVNFRAFSSSFFFQQNLSLKQDDVALVVELRKVTESYYKYKKTLLVHLENQFGDIWDGVGQPGAVFTNIENGVGIFAGYSQVTDTIYKQ